MYFYRTSESMYVKFSCVKNTPYLVYCKKFRFYVQVTADLYQVILSMGLQGRCSACVSNSFHFKWYFQGLF